MCSHKAIKGYQLTSPVHEFFLNAGADCKNAADQSPTWKISCSSGDLPSSYAPVCPTFSLHNAASEGLLGEREPRPRCDISVWSRSDTSDEWFCSCLTLIESFLLRRRNPESFLQTMSCGEAQRHEEYESWTSSLGFSCVLCFTAWQVWWRLN